MVTTIISYKSHSQVWALEEEDGLVIGGRTNRATLTFLYELREVITEATSKAKKK